MPVSSPQKESPQAREGSLPTSTSSPPPPLQFITLTERPASHKNDYSYTVRSHAMQSFLHEKKNAKGDNAKQKRGPSKDLDQQTPKQLSGKFKLASWSRKPRSKKARTQVTEGISAESIVVKDEDVHSEVSNNYCKHSITCADLRFSEPIINTCPSLRQWFTNLTDKYTDTGATIPLYLPSPHLPSTSNTLYRQHSFHFQQICYQL